MSIVPLGRGPHPVRGDDGQGLQRRLLHDLERQWLDMWQVVGQEPGSVEDAADGRQQDERSPVDAVVDVQAPLIMQDAVASAGPAATQRTSVVESAPASGGAEPAAAGSADQALQASRAENETDGGSTLGSAPDGRESASLQESRNRSTAMTKVAIEPRSMPGTHAPAPISGGEPSRVVSGGTSPRQVGLGPPASPVQVGSMTYSGKTSGPADLLDDPSPTAVPRDPDASGRISAAAPAQHGQESSETPDELASRQAASKRTPPSTSSPPESHGPQRLTLRELSEHQVLASMRDSLLTPAQSQLAAQSLARALMEAGYARVQVVVNGKPMSSPAPTATQEAGSSPSPSLPSNPSRETPHGH